MNTKEYDSLIIFNPNCGTFNGKQLLDTFTNKYMKQGVYKIICTNYESDLDSINDEFNDYQNIIIVGGDGTVFSVIQKILCKDIAIGVLPTGSGNGLSNSLLYNRGIELTDINYIKHLNNSITNNSTQLIDTMTVRLLNSNITMNSFLFISCGIFSNIDLNTEWLRKLGDFRFILGAIYELIKYLFFGNTIKGKLEYMDENNNLKIIEEGEFAFFMANNLSHTSKTSITSPLSKPDDGYIYLSYLKEPTNTWNLLMVLLGLEDGTFISRLKYRKTKWFNFIPENGTYDIDGEKYLIEPIEVSINPKSLKILN